VFNTEVLRTVSIQEHLKIMVSVIDPDEALEALKGGADIIDVKNPREGALGANRPWITKKIKEETGNQAEVSATIGDLPNTPGTASLAALGAATLGVDYVKAGMLGPKTFGEVEELCMMVAQTLQEFRLRTKLVIAGYADYQTQGCVNPLMLPRSAAEAGAWGVLIDVKEKSSKGLFDYLSVKDLEKFVEDAHHLGLKVALAGALGKKDLQRVLKLGVDIMGIRRNVCTKLSEEPKVDHRLVEEFISILQRTQ
jgi:uncharacterized protein (UPF0264 family)